MMLDDRPLLSRSWLEVATALLLAGVGVAILVGALGYKIGWDESGPQPGYVPFDVGLVVIVGAVGSGLQALGLAFAAVGMGSVSGSLRLAFGISELLRGIIFLVAVIGLVGIGELLLTMGEGLRFEGVKARVTRAGTWTASACLDGHRVSLLRLAVIGIWMGITPGGPMAAAWPLLALLPRLSGVRAPGPALDSAGSR